ncbi:MAG TPA: hypothetical protein VFB96_23415, partial [Pirellulaceae bacterium]|nr:hypothetical protein [Pirellulaceae bacterium]
GEGVLTAAGGKPASGFTRGSGAMSVFLFTHHGYRNWMPDREEGFVRKGKGMRPPDNELNAYCRFDAAESEVTFDHAVQRVLIDEAQVAAEKQNFRLHFVATETTHAHVLVSWKDDRPWTRLRASIKSSFSRRLSRDIKRRTWLSENASRRHVEKQDHFDYLVNVYLPDHRGWKWCEGRGAFLSGVQSSNDAGARAQGKPGGKFASG